MENEACLAAIRNQYNTLTKTERQIADYILANSSSVVEMSVADLGCGLCCRRFRSHPVL